MPINRDVDTTISVQINRDLAEKFRIYAKLQNRSASGQSRELIMKWIEEIEKKSYNN